MGDRVSMAVRNFGESYAQERGGRKRMMTKYCLNGASPVLPRARATRYGTYDNRKAMGFGYGRP